MFGLGLIKKVFGAAKRLKELEEAVSASKAFFCMGVELEKKYRALDVPGDIKAFLSVGKKMADEWGDVL